MPSIQSQNATATLLLVIAICRLWCYKRHAKYNIEPMFKPGRCVIMTYCHDMHDHTVTCNSNLVTGYRYLKYMLVHVSEPILVL